MIVNKINEFLEKENKSLEDGFKFLLKQEFSQLSGFSFDRQFLSDRKESDGELRFSSAGKCPRALAYGYHKYEKNGKELDSRGLRTFFMGDVTEVMIVLLAKAAGVPIFGYGLQQPKLSWTIGNKEIQGHPDGFVIDVERILTLEVKSMNTQAFTRFEKGEIDDSYIYQMNANMKAAGTSACLYVAFNKDNSVLGEKIVARDEKIIKKIEENLLSVINSTPSTLPKQPFEPNEDGFLPWNCLYCAYHKTCWPNAEKKLVGKAYKLRIDLAKEFELSSMGNTNG